MGFLIWVYCRDGISCELLAPAFLFIQVDDRCKALEVKHFDLADVGRAAKLVEIAVADDDKAGRTSTLIQLRHRVPAVRLDVVDLTGARAGFDVPGADDDQVAIPPADQPMRVPRVQHVRPRHELAPRLVQHASHAQIGALVGDRPTSNEDAALYLDALIVPHARKTDLLGCTFQIVAVLINQWKHALVKANLELALREV